MDSQSIIELQKIDCNCNDCGYMKRDFNKFEISLYNHYKWTMDHFNAKKNNLLEKAMNWRLRGFINKAEPLEKEASSMNFHFEKKKVTINYGYCHKLNKNVSFIPNVLQLDTQGCFKHRKIC